jgi:hypothetical protein
VGAALMSASAVIVVINARTLKIKANPQTGDGEQSAPSDRKLSTRKDLAESKA